MRGSRKFSQRGSNLDKVFIVDEGREDPNTIPLKWRFAGVPMMAQY